MKPLTHKRMIEYELEGFGIRLNKTPPDITVKKKVRLRFVPILLGQTPTQCMYVGRRAATTKIQKWRILPLLWGPWEPELCCFA